MNVELLRKVQKHILEEPRRLDMNTLGERRTGENAPPCNTAACIAGWTCLLALQEEEYTWIGGELFVIDAESPWEKAKDLLGLSEEQGLRLFREPFCASETRPSWPVKIADQYIRTADTRERAQITSDRIDLFIESNGAK